MCSIPGVRILLTTAELWKWCQTNNDVEAAFLQTGATEGDVYVIPPRESADHSKVLWLLLTVAYGLVKANDKWQAQSDTLLSELGFIPVKFMHHLFLLQNSATPPQPAALVVKVVDHILIDGTADLNVNS